MLNRELQESMNLPSFYPPHQHFGGIPRFEPTAHTPLFFLLPGFQEKRTKGAVIGFLFLCVCVCLTVVCGGCSYTVCVVCCVKLPPPNAE